LLYIEIYRHAVYIYYAINLTPKENKISLN